MKSNSPIFLSSIQFQQEGIVLIDKPSGLTSHDVVNQIRHLTHIKRVGHSGTLDPLASGLLIILIGRSYTKQQTSFLKLDKEYLCTARLGATTDSYDSQGKITSQCSWEKLYQVELSHITAALNQFKGKIAQTVPMFSAVKINGHKLYQLMRQKKLSSLQTIKTAQLTRTIEIFAIKLLDFKQNEQEQLAEFSIQVHCSSGTYIRSLIHDIGQVLGCGAYVTQLRRIKIGQYDVKQALTLP